MQKATDAPDIFSAYIDFAVHDEPCNFLPLSPPLETEFFLIQGKSLICDNPTEFLHERLAFQKHIVVAAEGYVVSISGIGHLETLCQSSQPLVEANADCIRKYR